MLILQEIRAVVFRLAFAVISRLATFRLVRSVPILTFGYGYYYRYSYIR